jgi:hypothetical protein
VAAPHLCQRPEAQTSTCNLASHATSQVHITRVYVVKHKYENQTNCRFLAVKRNEAEIGRCGANVVWQTRPRASNSEAFTPYSHSIILSHDNALISKRRIFRLAAKFRHPVRQKLPLLILEGNFCNSESVRFQPLLASIGRFFGDL